MIIRFGNLPSFNLVLREARRILDSGDEPPAVTDPDLLDAIISIADSSVTFMGPNGKEITRDIAWSLRYEAALDLIKREQEKPV